MKKRKNIKVCRDCPKCTESSAKTFVLKPVRTLGNAATSWNVGLFQRKCPQCGHKLSIHKDKRDIY